MKKPRKPRGWKSPWDDYFAIVDYGELKAGRRDADGREYQGVRLIAEHSGDIRLARRYAKAFLQWADWAEQKK
jgi:hypothetical protein